MEDKFYQTALRLKLEDYKQKGITLQEAYDLYNSWNIGIIYKNGEIEYVYE